MRKEEFVKSMLELGATLYNGGYGLFVETNDGVVEYWYNEKAEKFTVKVNIYGEDDEREFDTLSLHYKDHILSCGINLYAELMFEYGKKYKLGEIKRALEL